MVNIIRRIYTSIYDHLKTKKIFTLTMNRIFIEALIFMRKVATGTL